MINTVWKTFEGWYDDFHRDSVPLYVLISLIVCLASFIFGIASLEEGADPSSSHRYVVLAPMFVGVSAITAWLISLIGSDDLTTVALSFTYIAAVFVSSSLLCLLLIEVPTTVALFVLVPSGIIFGLYWLLVKWRK